MSAERVTTRGQTAVGTGVSALDALGYRLQRLPLHIVIAIFVAVWIIPTIGMIINSFRGVADMSQSGWWTALFPPHGFTLASYKQVLALEGVAPSILYSVLITIP